MPCWPCSWPSPRSGPRSARRRSVRRRIGASLSQHVTPQPPRAGRADRPASARDGALRARRRACLRPCARRRTAATDPIADANGARWARPAPAALYCSVVSAKRLWRVAARAAQALGFIVDPTIRAAASSPVRAAPACACGLIAARALAAEIARDVPLGGEGLAVHVSGCAKGCAHPAAAPLTIVGTRSRLRHHPHGTARATSSIYVDPAELISALSGEHSKTREAVNA